jgi:hypothetical protein
MAYVDWRIRGPEMTACNCSWGCPCQFNSLPTFGDCRAVAAMRIDEGHFADVDLSGLKWAALFAWPEAIHFGHGEALIVIDERADEAQRNALLTILSGQETEPGATIFNVFATTLEKVHEPLFMAIDFEADVESRTGRISIDGVVDTSVEPIRNPVTGDLQRVSVNLPNGFEYKRAEYASGTVNASGPIPHDWSGRHAHLAVIDMSPAGVA